MQVLWLTYTLAFPVLRLGRAAQNSDAESPWLHSFLRDSLLHM
ncbi:Uncharacterised protein [Vibrio cholerae]|nr:Uncharacterised protein [Vibrio cholerae]